MSWRGDWRRVSKGERCPICERPDWCLVAGPEGALTAAICARIESPKRAGQAGWLHVLRDDGPTWAPWRAGLRRAVKMAEPTPERPAVADVAATAARWSAEHPDGLERFARSLGLSADSLRRLGVGYLPKRRAWGFPMRDAAGAVVGIRLRLAGGRKLSVKGGKEGLFVPVDLAEGGRLLITEGPTDCAALLDLGFAAVGRPSCSGGVPHLLDLARRLRPEEIIIMADGDGPGQRGAADLARRLVAFAVVRVITPPDTIKDARAWLQCGGTHADVQERIDATEPTRLKIATRKKGKAWTRKT